MLWAEPRSEDAQKRLISATAAAQKRRVGGLAYESPAALRGWRSGEQAGTCSAVLGAAGESRERGRGWPPRAAKAKYRTILRRSERKAVSWLWGGGWLRGVKSPSWAPHCECNGRGATCQRHRPRYVTHSWRDAIVAALPLPALSRHGNPTGAGPNFSRSPLVLPAEPFSKTGLAWAAMAARARVAQPLQALC